MSLEEYQPPRRASGEVAPFDNTDGSGLIVVPSYQGPISFYRIPPDGESMEMEKLLTFRFDPYAGPALAAFRMHDSIVPLVDSGSLCGGQFALGSGCDIVFLCDFSSPVFEGVIQHRFENWRSALSLAYNPKNSLLAGLDDSVGAHVWRIDKTDLSKSTMIHRCLGNFTGEVRSLRCFPDAPGVWPDRVLMTGHPSLIVDLPSEKHFLPKVPKDKLFSYDTSMELNNDGTVLSCVMTKTFDLYDARTFTHISDHPCAPLTLSSTWLRERDMLLIQSRERIQVFDLRKPHVAWASWKFDSSYQCCCAEIDRNRLVATEGAALSGPEHLSNAVVFRLSDSGFVESGKGSRLESRGSARGLCVIRPSETGGSNNSSVLSEKVDFLVLPAQAAFGGVCIRIREATVLMAFRSVAGTTQGLISGDAKFCNSERFSTLLNLYRTARP